MTQTEWILQKIKECKHATGGDTSRWNGQLDLTDIDMDLFVRSMDFFILRAGYGAQDGSIVEDVKFDSNYAIIEQLKDQMPFGVYWYLSSHSAWDKQFQKFINVLENKEFTFYILDFEEAYNEMGLAFATIAIKFIRALRAMFPDKRIFLYAGRYNYVELWKHYPEIDGYSLWHPQYPWKTWKDGLTQEFIDWWTKFFNGEQLPSLANHLDPNEDWELWQAIANSGIGNEMGFPENDSLDFNISRRLKAEFFEWLGFNGVITPEPEPEPEPEEPSEEYKNLMLVITDFRELIGNAIEEINGGF